MNFLPSVVRLAVLCLFASTSFAQTLEELLVKEQRSIELSTREADEQWRRVVEAFRVNDMTKAQEEGGKFLTGAFKASAFQVLGTKVMVALAGGAAPGTTFEDKGDQDAYNRLSAERETIKKRFLELSEVIRLNDAKINEITLNRSRPVQQGSSNYFACVECDKQIATARRAQAAWAEPIEKNKKEMAALLAKSNSALKPMTMQLFDLLLGAGEIEAAAAIANTYLRVIGNDLDIAVKQQDIARLQEVAKKAVKVMDLLVSEVRPLIDGKTYWQANEHIRNFIAKVESMSADKELVQIVRTRVSVDDTFTALRRNVDMGERHHDLIVSQADLDPTIAQQEYAAFKTKYPDHPRLRELELHVSSVKAKSADEILAKAEADLEGLKKRFDPEKLRAKLSQNASGSSALASLLSTPEATTQGNRAGTAQSSEEALLEVGVAPGDHRVVKLSLDGLGVQLAFLERSNLPEGRKARLAALRREVDALRRLTHP
jgi:hypothetical protein